MALSADDSTLQPLADEELRASLEVYRRGRRSSAQRRREVDYEVLRQFDELQALTATSEDGRGDFGVSLASAARAVPAALGVAPLPDLSAGQVVRPSSPRRPSVSPPPRVVLSVSTQTGVRPAGLPPILFPAPGLSVQDLVDFVRLHPTLSAGQVVSGLEQRRGSRYTAAQRLQLAGFATTAIAAESAICGELMAAWDTVARRSDLPPEEAARARQLEFTRLLARVREAADRFLPREHTATVDPGVCDFPAVTASD